MKITDPEIIKTGERDLIEAVKGDLDWQAIGEIIKEKIDRSSVDSTGGQIIVHDNQVAFRVDLVVKMDLSLIFDRDGNLISDNADSGKDQVSEILEPAPAEEDILTLDEVSTLDEVPALDDVQTPEALADIDSLPGNEDETEMDPGIELPELDLDDLDLTSDEVSETLDDDIDEILKESRDFWENKKTD